MDKVKEKELEKLAEEIAANIVDFLRIDCFLHCHIKRFEELAITRIIRERLKEAECEIKT